MIINFVYQNYKGKKIKSILFVNFKLRIFNCLDYNYLQFKQLINRIQFYYQKPIPRVQQLCHLTVAL